LTSQCGTNNAAGIDAPCGPSDASNAVIFPTAPVISAPANTCNSAFLLPTVTAVAGFTIQYSINGGTYATAAGLAPLPATPGCYHIKARYVLTNGCGSTTANTAGTGSCGESNQVDVVIFPLAPPAPATGSCGPIVVTPPASVSGFMIQYSFDDGVTWGANTPPTPDNCTGYKIRTRYVTEFACGSIAANTCSSISGCDKSPATTRIVDNTAPTITCPASAPFTRSTNAGQCTYKVYGAEFNPTATDACTLTPSLAWTVTNPNAATQNGTTTLANVYLSYGMNTITWTATDACSNTSTCSYSVNINYVTTTTSLVVSTIPITNPVTQQYSDRITCVATVTPYDCTGAGFIGGTVTFKIGSLVLGTAPVGSDGKATLTDALLLEDQLYDANLSDPLNATSGPLKPGAKTVTAYYSGTDPDYIVSNATAALTVTCEDVDLNYTGGTYFTVNPSTLKGTVYLTANGIDRNDGATTRGDIRNATVTFRDGGPGGTIKGERDSIPMGLIDPANKQEGIASTFFQDQLNSSQVSSGGLVYQMWVGANNYYCGNMAGDLIPVTLAMPGQDFVTGGGYIILTNNVSGTYGVGAGGMRMNGGLVMKWNSSGKNLQGQVNIIYRRMENGVKKIYQIKSNAINTLVVESVNNLGAVATGTNITFRRAIINTKANLTDITNPLAPVSLGGNLALLVTAWESTTVNTGALDRISVQLTGSGSTGLLFSSNWTSGATIPQTLNGGKMQVRDNSTPPAAPIAVTPNRSETVEAIAQTGINIIAYPNPSHLQFTMKLESDNKKDEISVRITDIYGRVIQRFDNRHANELLLLGHGYMPGVYFVEMIQGDKRKTIRLIKQ
jgi:hypothetical protein